MTTAAMFVQHYVSLFENQKQATEGISAPTLAQFLRRKAFPSHGEENSLSAVLSKAHAPSAFRVRTEDSPVATILL